MVVRKKLILFSLFIIFYTSIHAQRAGWMMGTWKGATGTINIDDVSGESFSGTKTTETNNSKTTIAISGAFRGRGFYLQDGEVLRREGPETGQEDDCAACLVVNKMTIRRDSLILINSISDCSPKCDGETFFYRLLTEYDSSTQRYLVDRFGRPSDIIGFQPRRLQKDKPVASSDEEPLKNDVTAVAGTAAEKAQRLQDSLNNIRKIKQQQTDDSIRIAQQKKRQQEITDSLNLAKQKQQQRIKDSLDNVARLEQIRLKTEDSLRDVQAKKRQQEITDSLNLAKQKQQQRIKDSLNNIARLEQIRLRTEDSLRDVQAKKRQQEITDSLNLAKQKQQQRIKDSLNNVARLEQIRLRTEDSLRDVQAKKRQQEITDSLNLAKQKQQQRIKDSLDNIAKLEQIRLRTEDSLRDVQARKKQQEADSLAALRKKQYDDSLQQSLAKAAPPPVPGQTDDNKALTTRTSVLLETIHITSPDILIELFDNGEIDGDRVSVFHNNELIVSNQVLGIKPITVKVHADAANREHEFVLVAENLGSIPPNSALMRVTAGKQSYKLPVNTDMKTNARIVLYYDGN